MILILGVVLAIFLAVTLCLQNFQLRQQVQQVNTDATMDLRYAAECSEKATHLLETAPALALVETARAMELMRVMHSKYGNAKLAELGEDREGDFQDFIAVLEAQKKMALDKLVNHKKKKNQNLN